MSGKKNTEPMFTAVSDGMVRFNSLRPPVNAAFSALFVLLALLSVIPVVFTAIVSFSSEASIAKAGYTFFPAEWSTEAYTYVWHLQDRSGFPAVLRALLNSLTMTLIGTVLGLALISSMGYVLSRRHFRLRRFYSFFIFIPMIFNGGLLATYVINAQLLHLKNTIWAVILPLACSPFYIMMMATFFRTSVPDEMIESGMIDGAGQIRIFARLVLPVSLPALATVALFLTFGYWNDWYQASLYLESYRHDLFPLQYVLVNIEKNIQFLANSDMAMSVRSGALPTETMRMAVVVITVVPIMFSYPFFQKFFVSGLTVGSVKG